MQKKFIALAVAGLVSGAAFAQSNVTVYGVMDLGFDVASATGAASGSSANRGSFTRISTQSSLIGFKGTEALGNGLNAIFQIESGVTADGTAGNTFGVTRDTFVGLESKTMGTVKLGLQTGPTRLLGLLVDMNAGATGAGANSSLIGKAAAGAGAGAFDTRFANTVSYASPSFGGLTVVGAYVSGENKSLDNAGVAKINTSGYDLGAIYNNGPIVAGLTYGKIDNGIDSNVAAVSVDNQSIWRLAGAYTFNGGHKIGALYEQNKNEYKLLGASGDLKRNVWGLGGKFMVSPAGGLIAQYYKANNPSGNFYAANDNRGAQMYEIGYEHALSKRTMLKASYTRLDNKDNANYDFNIGAVGGGFGVGANPTVISAGVRHSF